MSEVVFPFIQRPYTLPLPMGALDKIRRYHSFLGSPAAIVRPEESVLIANGVPVLLISAPGKVQAIVVIVLSSRIGEEVDRIGFFFKGPSGVERKQGNTAKRQKVTFHHGWATRFNGK